LPSVHQENIAKLALDLAVRKEHEQEEAERWGVGLEDEVTIYWNYVYKYATDPAMTAFAPLVVHERLVKWNERIGRAQTGMRKWLLVDGHEVFFCPGQRGHGPGGLWRVGLDLAAMWAYSAKYMAKGE